MWLIIVYIQNIEYVKHFYFETNTFFIVFKVLTILTKSGIANISLFIAQSLISDKIVNLYYHLMNRV